MQISYLNTSVVVLAQQHNPSLLHPTFLLAEKIVPQDWQVAEPPICTPPISLVKYANGVTFLLEMNKFQVQDNNPSKNISESQVAQLALNFVSKLPHVKYTAVGINVNGFVARPDAEKFLFDKFLKSECLENEKNRLQAAGFRLVYPVDGSSLRLSLDAGAITDSKTQQAQVALLLNANYHHDLPRNCTVENVKQAIMNCKDRYAHFEQMATFLLGENKKP